LGGAILVIVVSIFLGWFLSDRLRMPDYFGKFGTIAFCLIASITVTALGWPPKLGIDLSGGVILVYEVAEEQEVMPAKGIEGGQQEAQSQGRGKVDMEKLIGAIKKRIDPASIKEVTIRQRGARQVEIIVPEVDADEVARLERVITNLGTLEFRILATERNQQHQSLIRRAKQSQADELRNEQGELLAWWVPVAKGKESSFDFYQDAVRWRERNGVKVMEVLVVDDPFDVHGGYLARAAAARDQELRPCVNFTFDVEGGQRFRRLTTMYKPDEVQDFRYHLGIILSGYLYSAPAIQSVISQHGQITGDFTEQEVNELVDVLNAGSLPAVLTEEPVSRLVTGPQLGLDTIIKGSWAIGISMGLVVLFMLFYYRFAGLVACMAVLLNLLLIMAVMITVHAAFTLPGIAGLVLTVGMAVDANVLIFERIREELNKGSALRMAIRNGFQRATSAIVDANLTTLITASVLYVVGTDQVRGFAVVLWLGVVMSMFTAIYCSRVVFDVAERKRWISRLAMLQIVKNPQIDFLGKRRLWAGISAGVILLGLAGVFVRGPGILDIDFTGGVSIEVLFDEPQDITEIRRKLRGLPDLAVANVQLEYEEPNRRFVINTAMPAGKGEQMTPEEYLEYVQQEINKAFPGQIPHYSVEVRYVEEAATAAQPVGSPDEGDQTHFRPYVPLPGPWTAAAMLLTQAGEGESAGEAGEADREKVDADTGQPGPTPSPPAEAAQPQDQSPGSASGAADAAVSAPSPPSQAQTPAQGAAGSRTRATLDFGEHKFDIGTLNELFAEKVREERQSAGDGPNVDELRYELHTTAGGGREAEQQISAVWEVTVYGPPERARALLESVKAEIDSMPFFPSSNTIGGKVAVNTRVQAAMALLASLFFIVAYLWVRFQRVMYGLAAVVALVHDVLVTLGMIALSAFVAGWLGFLLIDEFKIGLPVLAAFLTIIGYSLNDTIVVFDRIREVRGKAPQLTEEMINTSINQTLSRTLLTSLTTLMVVLVLYIGGGHGIHAFAFSLVVGVIVGTYSSIFVASPVLLWMSQRSAAQRR